MELKREIDEWPRIRNQVDELRQEIVKSMVLVLYPDGHVDGRLVRSVLQVQQDLVDILVVVEEEMM